MAAKKACEHPFVRKLVRGELGFDPSLTIHIFDDGKNTQYIKCPDCQERIPWEKLGELRDKED